MRINRYLTLKREKNKKKPKVVSLCHYRKTRVIKGALHPDDEEAFRQIEGLEIEYKIIDRMANASLGLLKNHKVSDEAARIVYRRLMDSFDEVMIFLQGKLDKITGEDSVPKS